MNDTKQLAQWVIDTDYDGLPPEVIEATRVYILDDLASGFAGARLPWTRIVSDLALESNTGSCSIFGSPRTTSPSSAALINGVAIGGFETDHPFSRGSCHPSGAVFPAVLATGETAHIDGKAFLAAVATGYEAVCRVSLAATRAVEDVRGFHGPGTNAPIGGAIGAGKALGFDAATMVNAIGIAVSHGSGLLEFHHEGAMTKRLHLGRGSQLGVESALLAQRGFTGPSTALEGEHGFLNVYSPGPKPEELLAQLGTEYRMLGITIKAFPCHVSFHAVIDALVRFKQTHPLDPETITGIEVVSKDRMMSDRFQGRTVTTLMGAQYSMPWSCALTLCHDTADPATWSEESLGDKLVARLATEIRLRNEAPSNPNGLAEVILEHDGRRDTIVATDWKGAPTNPATFEDMAQKFRRYAANVLTPAQIEELIERIAKVETEKDVAALAALIRG
jgi:2-methylcitrate dehydratase PrpD